MAASKPTPKQILNFYHLAEKLKTIMRHSWLSDGDGQESVAEHTWMMALMALALMPHMEQELDQLKVLKMIVLHDLAEALTEDMPVWEGVKNKAAKQAAEEKAIKQIFSHLEEDTRKDLLEVWQEYEDRESVEARFVKAIDTLDVVQQHNESPIETWNDLDFEWQLSPLQDGFFDIDPFLREVKNAIDEHSIQKADAAGGLDKLNQKELAKRQK